VLLCTRVADMPIPPTLSVIKHCGQCGERIWVAHSSPPVDRMLCMACATQAMDVDPDVEVEPPSAQQVADLERWLTPEEMRELLGWFGKQR